MARLTISTSTLERATKFWGSRDPASLLPHLGELHSEVGQLFHAIESCGLDVAQVAIAIADGHGWTTHGRGYRSRDVDLILTAPQELLAALVGRSEFREEWMDVSIEEGLAEIQGD